jgi:IstB-like ATP binding protein
MELDRRGAELLFQVLTEREERSAVAIASNEPDGWATVFGDQAVAAAMIDRIVHHADVFPQRRQVPAPQTRHRQPPRHQNSEPGVLKPQARGLIFNRRNVPGFERRRKTMD